MGCLQLRIILGILQVLKFHTMSELYKLEILRAVSKDAAPGKPARFSFTSLTKTLDLSKENLDRLLVELEKDRFIKQYLKKGVDGFTLILNQKGLDAVQDESFI
jgi:CTP-dependent riboflavin kinase